METSRSKLTNPSSMEWILGHDSSFFENKMAQSVNRAYLDLQVVPNNDVFDPLWIKADEDVMPTRSFHSSRHSDVMTHATSKAVDVHINKLDFKGTRKLSADSDSLDVYLKPCVITPTKVEDLYSTLDDNSDNDVFLFPPNETTSLTSLANFEQLVGDYNSREQHISYHDNIRSKSNKDSTANFNAMDTGNYQKNTFQSMQHSGLFFPPFLKHLSQESCFTAKKEPSCPSLIHEQRNSKSALASHDSGQQNVSIPCEIDDSGNNQNTIFFESAPKDRFQHKHEVKIACHKNLQEWNDTCQLKAFHNDTEKQRRDQMKTRFESLRRVIPKVEKLQKAPKILILRKAWEYIIHLQKEDDRLESLKGSLKLTNKQLLDKLQTMILK